jgi:hypothetical protein
MKSISERVGDTIADMTGRLKDDGTSEVFGQLSTEYPSWGRIVKVDNDEWYINAWIGSARLEIMGTPTGIEKIAMDWASSIDPTEL